MNVQYIIDSQGHKTSVIIPIQDWEQLKKEYTLPDSLLANNDEPDKYIEPTDEEILEGVREALREVKLCQEGKLKLQSLDELLNEL